MGYFDRLTKEIKLVTDPNLWVKLYTDFNYDEMEFFNDKRGAAEGLHKLAADWNLGVDLTLDNIRKLKAEDIQVLFAEMAKIIEQFTSTMNKKKVKTSISSKQPENPSKA